MWFLLPMALAKESDVLVGYVHPWAHKKQTLMTEAAQNGYSILCLAFADVKGSTVELHQDWDNVYRKDWNNADGKADVKKTMQIDMDGARAAKPGLKILISVGGGNNLFKPGGGTPVSTLATNIKAFVTEYGFDGIDFDLEGLHGSLGTEPEKYLTDLTTALLGSMMITCAPQFNCIGCNQPGQEGEVHFVNTREERIYEGSIAAGHYDYIFVQLYNTGHYCLKADGMGVTCKDSEWGGAACAADRVNQCHPGYIVRAFNRIKNLVKGKTKLVIGEPSIGSDAGAISIFKGSHKANAYTAMKNAMKAIEGEALYAGVMTWSVNGDSSAGWQFAKNLNGAAVSQGTAMDVSGLPANGWNGKSGVSGGGGQATQTPAPTTTTQAPGGGQSTQTPAPTPTTQAPGGGQSTQAGGGQADQAPGEGQTTQSPGEGQSTQSPTEAETDWISAHTTEILVVLVVALFFLLCVGFLRIYTSGSSRSATADISKTASKLEPIATISQKPPSRLSQKPPSRLSQKPPSQLSQKPPSQKLLISPKSKKYQEMLRINGQLTTSKKQRSTSTKNQRCKGNQCQRKSERSSSSTKGASKNDCRQRKQ